MLRELIGCLVQRLVHQGTADTFQTSPQFPPGFVQGRLQNQELVIRGPLLGCGCDPVPDGCFSLDSSHIEMLEKPDLVFDLGESFDPVERHPGFESFPQIRTIPGPSHGPRQGPGGVGGHIEPTRHPFRKTPAAIPGRYLMMIQLRKDLQITGAETGPFGLVGQQLLFQPVDADPDPLHAHEHTFAQ
jgi:hypothetical protein